MAPILNAQSTEGSTPKGQKVINFFFRIQKLPRQGLPNLLAAEMET